jgi:thiosulfate dehydrogenase [quinone] large subunit
MWAAEWPPAQHLSTGGPTFSSIPLVDYHVLYALVMIMLAAAYAGNTWGLGRIWAGIPFIRRNNWLL